MHPFHGVSDGRARSVSRRADDDGTPEIIKNHIIDSLQYALRNYGQVFTSKEVEWLSVWDYARIPLAASRELQKRVAETSR